MFSLSVFSFSKNKLNPNGPFVFCVFLFFFFFFSSPVSAFLGDKIITVYNTVHALKNIKNESHGTIHTFKNYLATVFSVSVFNFSKNKLNPNTLYKFRFLKIRGIKFNSSEGGVRNTLCFLVFSQNRCLKTPALKSFAK